MATDDEKEQEKNDTVAFALESTIVLSGMSALCAFARYVGISAEELHGMFDTASDSVDDMIAEAEKDDEAKPNLAVVKDKHDKH